MTDITGSSSALRPVVEATDPRVLAAVAEGHALLVRIEDLGQRWYDLGDELAEAFPDTPEGDEAACAARTVVLGDLDSIVERIGAFTTVEGILNARLVEDVRLAAERRFEDAHRCIDHDHLVDALRDAWRACGEPRAVGDNLAERLREALSDLAAELGGVEELVKHRPGCWEAELVRLLGATL